MKIVRSSDLTYDGSLETYIRKTEIGMQGSGLAQTCASACVKCWTGAMNPCSSDQDFIKKTKREST
jgi:hypothetical protein